MHKVTFLLLIVGGINWLLVGAAGWDIGSFFGGMDALVSRIVYILMGVAAVYEVVSHKKNCRGCAPSSANTMGPNKGM